MYFKSQLSLTSKLDLLCAAVTLGMLATSPMIHSRKSREKLMVGGLPRLNDA
jgi:hypothetical protein